MRAAPEVTSYPAQQLFPKKKDLETAREVRELCRCLGHIGTEGIIRSIKSGSWTGCNITVADVRRADELLGPCPGCTRGKMTDSKRHYSTPAVEVPKVSETGDIPPVDILHADFVFLPGSQKGRTTVLLSVSERTRLITASRMVQRTREELEANWTRHLTPFRTSESRPCAPTTSLFLDPLPIFWLHSIHPSTSCDIPPARMSHSSSGASGQ